MPVTEPKSATAPIKPRRSGFARSTRKTMEVVYSPPTERPCIIRNNVSRTGAMRPSTSYPGSTPIRNVGTAMAATDAVSAARRPNRSPIWPNTAPPIGRIRKPTAKTPKAARICATLSCWGKKAWPIDAAK